MSVAQYFSLFLSILYENKTIDQNMMHVKILEIKDKSMIGNWHRQKIKCETKYILLENWQDRNTD